MAILFTGPHTDSSALLYFVEHGINTTGRTRLLSVHQWSFNGNKQPLSL